MFRGVDPIHKVVSAHHRPRLSAFHGDLEGGKIDLVHRALIEIRARGHPFKLLVVHRIMFQRGAHTLALNPFDVSDGHLPGQQRILGEILEIPTAKG